MRIRLQNRKTIAAQDFDGGIFSVDTRQRKGTSARMSLSFGLRLPGMGVSQAISNIRGQMRSALLFVLFLGGAGKQGAGHSILFQIKLMAYFYCYYSLSRWLFQVL